MRPSDNCLNIFNLIFIFFFLCDVQKDEEVEFFRNKFAGSQADRADRAVKEEAEAKKNTEKLKNTKISGDYFLFIFDCLVNPCYACFIFCIILQSCCIFKNMQHY